MKPCPVCGHARAYSLADGRRKCVRCGHRFSWTSAWDSIRLLPRVKRKLLEQFAGGIPAYRLRDSSDVSAKSHERFNRVVRAACAMAEHVDQSTCRPEAYPDNGLAARLEVSNGPANPRGIVFALSEEGQRVAVAGVNGEASEPGSTRTLEMEGKDPIRISLALRGGRVVCGGSKAPEVRAPGGTQVDRFCRFAMDWLHPYGTIRREYFHLYMGEICYRFNHSGGPIEPQLRALLNRYSIQELRPLLVRKG